MTRTIVLSLEVWRSTCRLVTPCGERFWSNDELLPARLAEVVQHARGCPDCRELTGLPRGVDRVPRWPPDLSDAADWRA